ncbi:hypothetical protein [Streptomyces sp. BRA346]|uniref:hypothetical protein n=1 Tax=Streptomyces sp. BRA346 TaxID=2878199 RepID=UPI0040631412
MKTGLRITAFAAALAATFGTAYGVGSGVGEISPEPKSAAHGEHADAARPEEGGGHEQGHEQGQKTDVPGGLQISDGGYTLDVKTPRLQAGKSADLRFAIVRNATGRQLTRYDREHEKELHLIVASIDLTEYRHLHPTRAADGTWSTPVDLPKAGGYRVFADFKPTGGEALTLGADLAVAGAYAPKELPARTTTARTGGYEVRLGGDLTPGTAGELTFTVTRNGTPVRDLQPYLGAYGHLVALRSGDLAYLHVHPNGEPGDGKTRPGPGISFTATAPTPGAYRLFLDFKHQGTVRTAAFTVPAQGAAGTAAGATGSEHSH